jgi:hypothetical protein
MSRVPLTLMWLAAIVCSASAQDASSSSERLSPPALGGTIPPNPAVPPPTFGPRAGTEILRHRDFTGKPCLTVLGHPRPHVVDRNLYDHVITVSNACPQRIALQVCYYKTHDCISIEVPGGERKDGILGTLPWVKDFGFEFREKF